jgi:hypothetical protein
MNRTQDTAPHVTRFDHWADKFRRTQRRLMLALAVAVTCGHAGSGGPLSREEGTWLGAVGVHDASARGGRGGGGMRRGGMRGAVSLAAECRARPAAISSAATARATCATAGHSALSASLPRAVSTAVASAITVAMAAVITAAAP